MPGLRSIPAVSCATPVGRLSAQLSRPRPRSGTSAISRLLPFPSVTWEGRNPPEAGIDRSPNRRSRWADSSNSGSPALPSALSMFWIGGIKRYELAEPVASRNGHRRDHFQKRRNMLFGLVDAEATYLRANRLAMPTRLGTESR